MDRFDDDTANEHCHPPTPPFWSRMRIALPKLRQVVNPTPPRCLTVLFQQAAWKGNFRRDQKADNYLKHCWGQVLEVDGVKQQPEHESDPLTSW